MSNANESTIDNVSVDLSVRVGKVSMKIGKLKDLKEGSIVELDTQASDSFELLAGEQLLGKGTVEEVDGKIKFTITETA
ncbi:FliM/FliN family flagellar motor switch protein [Vibrio parahaemolyticus]|uniref:FliM/FliN family flagellar motor switch protein n=1 Tax=Vibrio parahaemolyticus TaxID=670 RepID=A0AAW8PZ47_VIBPH|nr:FliM/FliN family flagellar motor switch protein [Vibrio parahaemolyticus]EGR2229439.1 hypothetical protein [Vibrio parahaemolyticus]MDS1820836.1 FliM/FliN family flagellar motor switch protein [Vibrio parahaemolyticus]